MRYGIFKLIQFLTGPPAPPETPKAAPSKFKGPCDVCGSNCGQCGESHPQTGNGEEVFTAAVASVTSGNSRIEEARRMVNHRIDNPPKRDLKKLCERCKGDGSIIVLLCHVRDDEERVTCHVCDGTGKRKVNPNE